MLSEMLGAYDWDWFATLTSQKPMPLAILRARFFWWLRAVRRSVGRHIEVVWVIERQRRGALHIHAVIYGVPKERAFWGAMVRLWETYHTKPEAEARFGDATIRHYSPERSGALANYLAKERCKDLGVLEGSGSIFEKLGFSRGVKRFYDSGVDVGDAEGLFGLISGESINARSSDPENIPEGEGKTRTILPLCKTGVEVRA